MKTVKPHHDTVQGEGHGSVFRNEGLILTTLAHILGGPVLELGACMGVSSRFILDGLDPNCSGQHLDSIDRHHQWPGPEYSPIHHRHNHNTRDWRHIPKNGYAWAFIDGDHTYEGVKDDIATALACGCCTLVFHDTNPELQFHLREGEKENGAARAVTELDASGEWDVLELGTQCGLAIALKK